MSSRSLILMLNPLNSSPERSHRNDAQSKAPRMSDRRLSLILNEFSLSGFKPGWVHKILDSDGKILIALKVNLYDALIRCQRLPDGEQEFIPWISLKVKRLVGSRDEWTEVGSSLAMTLRGWSMLAEFPAVPVRHLSCVSHASACLCYLLNCGHQTGNWDLAWKATVLRCRHRHALCGGGWHFTFYGRGGSSFVLTWLMAGIHRGGGAIQRSRQAWTTVCSILLRTFFKSSEGIKQCDGMCWGTERWRQFTFCHAILQAFANRCQ